jgi:hypothetical protein
VVVWRGRDVHSNGMVFLLLAVGAFVLYVVSATMPRRGERFRQWVAPKLKRAEDKADKAPGLLGWLLKGPFWASRKSVDVSTDLGEKTHQKTRS